MEVQSADDLPGVSPRIPTQGGATLGIFLIGDGGKQSRESSKSPLLGDQLKGTSLTQGDSYQQKTLLRQRLGKDANSKVCSAFH